MDARQAMGTPYDEALSARVAAGGSLTVEPGVSGYFTKPGTTLDPNLFTGTKLRPAVAKLIMHPLFDYLDQYWHSAKGWTRVWLAGSGASYQWSADRDPGDLDILLALDHVRFRETNPRYAGLSNDDIDSLLTQALKRDLWPKTAHTNIGDAHYEVTYFVNPGHEDIREINPYAAYDVGRDRWTVPPIDLGADWDPLTQMPTDWWRTVDTEQRRARDVVTRYDSAQMGLASEEHGTPRWLNAVHALRQVINEGAGLFDSIHADRRIAFEPGGQGYRDFYNFRWQAYKRAGLTKPLHEMKTLQVESGQDAETSQYGAPIASAAEVLRDAATRRL